MGKFYSNTLERAIKLLYFQSNASKYTEAIKLLEKATGEKEADAFYFLARCYAWGDGNVQEDCQMARELSRQGIELGSDLCVLGAVRMNALNADMKTVMRHSLEDSLRALEKMAKEGDPMKQYAVGSFYFWGDMFMDIQEPTLEQFDRYKRENGKTALTLFRTAAEKGCIPAFRNVYISIRDGVNGIRKDVNEALNYVESIKNKVDIPGELCENIAYEYGKLDQKIEQIRWLKEGIKKGAANCFDTLGLAYLYGDGVLRDVKMAFSYFCRGAGRNSAYALYNLGRCYYYGWGTGKNENLAFSTFRDGAQKEHPASECFLARCYYEGCGTRTDYEKCFYWAEKSVRDGEPNAKLYLGICYFKGEGAPKDYETARRYFEECAVEAKNAAAWNWLGDIYDQGLGVTEDLERAVLYYQKALDGGYKEALVELARFKRSIFGKWKRI